MQKNEINILITDDIEDNRLVLRTICKKFKDVKIFEASNGLEAVEIVESEDIDIVLMDVMMPFMDGFEASKIIKSMKSPPYILIVTAVTDKETEYKFTKLGIDGYVRKPIDRESFKARLESLKSSCLIKKGANVGMATKKPLSKQATHCRNFKTYFLIENEEDAMNLGLWITEYRAKVDADITFEFEDSLAATYKICEAAHQKLETLTVVVEEDFEKMYLTFIPSNSLDCSHAAEKITDSVRANILCETTIIYLTINISSDVKTSKISNTASKNEAEKNERVDCDKTVYKTVRRIGNDKISAPEFMLDLHDSLIIEEMLELSEIEGRWRVCLLESTHKMTKANINLLVDSAIDEYARFINKICEFSSIGYAISSLSAFLRGVDEQRLTEIAPKLRLLLESALNDLTHWRSS
ncbi:MAG TPA: response regulator, partial [Campylobacterales bacterium]|nr:response regulator [Campylobacterales bacterium]